MSRRDLGTPPVRRVELYMCDPCLDGDGGECHVPGCSFWMSNAPTGTPIRERQLVTVFDNHENKQDEASTGKHADGAQ